MTFLKRVFSLDYRRALAAEAGGDYTEAARAYALAGEPAKVAEMHLLAAEQAGPEGRLVEARQAVRWAERLADPASVAASRALRQRAARLLATGVPEGDALGERDRGILREAALICDGIDEPALAGSCLERAGDLEAAGERYQRAGEVERMEAVLRRVEESAGRAARLHEAVEAAGMLLGAGQAEEAIARLGPLAHEGAAEAIALLDRIRARRVEGALVHLRVDGTPRWYAGRSPLLLGREAAAGLPLRDPGVSRRHAEFLGGASGWSLRALPGRARTCLDGIPLEAEALLPLPASGELLLGESARARFRLEGAPGAALLTLEFVGGIDRGLQLSLGEGRIPLDGAALDLRAAVPRLETEAGTLLNDRPVRGAVQLLVGDRVTLGATEAAPPRTLEVLGPAP